MAIVAWSPVPVGRSASRALSRAEHVMWMAAALTAATYGVLLATRLGGILGAEGWNSDVASTYLMPQDLVSMSHSGPVIMSTAGHWVELGLLLATARLPGHRALWGVGPWLLAVSCIPLLCWSVGRLASRRAAVVTAILMVCASTSTLMTFTSASFHNTVCLATTALGTFAVWAAMRPRHGLAFGAVTSLTSCVVGACVASDKLVVVAGLVPFALAGMLAASRVAAAQRRTILLPFAVVSLGSVAVALATSALMAHLGLSHVAPDRFGDSLGELSQRAIWMLEGVLRMGGADGLHHDAVRGALDLAGGTLALMSIAAALRMGWRTLTVRVSSGEPGAALGDAFLIHTGFWCLSMVCVAGAYVLVPVVNAPSDRYLISFIPALAALIPLTAKQLPPVVAGSPKQTKHERVSCGSAARRPGLVTVTAVTLFAALGVAALATKDAERTTRTWAQSALAPEMNRLAVTVRREHLGIGYAGYMTAGALRWNSRGAIPVYPVWTCSTGVCPFYLMRIAAWYRPHAGRRSFLLSGPNDQYLKSAPVQLGHPTKTVKFGSETMSIYPYDISTRLPQPR